MKVAFADGYFVQLPAHHRFPMRKFPALHDILRRERIVGADEVIAPDEAAWSDLELVHTPDYLSDLANGTLSPAAQRRLRFPWSGALVRRSRLAVHGTMLAAEMALIHGIAGNLGGGTHHAFSDRGEGFCVLNDVAVAVRVLRRNRRILRAVVIDLDVHQGNGTADIFSADEAVFTFSMHGDRNYPFRKARSRHDVALPDGTCDATYLAALRESLPDVLDAARPDIAFYLAGVDVVASDRYGRLDLSRSGLCERERIVLTTLRDYAIPVAIVLSGGYAATPELTADLHAEVYRVAAEVF